MKKKIVALILFGVMMLTMLSGCGSNNYAGDSTDSAEDQVSVTDNEKRASSKDESWYDVVDYTGNDYSGYTGDNPYGCTGLGMKMDGYYWTGGYLFYTDNDDLLITCTRLFDETDSSIPKNIEAFSSRFCYEFRPLLLLQDENYNFDEEECTINGFSCKKYEGTVMTKSNMTEPKALSAKAYTFVFNGCDYIVIAVVREETDENIKMMENEIDVFMNNLGIIEI